MSAKTNQQLAIVLEGLGGSGKSTTAELLIKEVVSRGMDVCSLKLPCYETPTGRILESILRPDGYTLIPKGRSLQELFAVNRGEISQFIESGIVMGWSFVIERWPSSNALSILDEVKRFKTTASQEFRFLKEIDKQFFSLFEGTPTFKFFLDVSTKEADVSRARRDIDRGLKDDSFEVDRSAYNTRAGILKHYIQLEQDWVVIDRKNLSAEGVSRQILEAVGPRLGIRGNGERCGRFVDFNEQVLGRVFREGETGTIGEILNRANYELEIGVRHSWSTLAPGWEKYWPAREFFFDSKASSRRAERI